MLLVTKYIHIDGKRTKGSGVRKRTGEKNLSFNKTLLHMNENGNIY